MSLTKIGSIGINTGIAFAGVTTIVTLNTANDALSIGATVNVGSGITLGASGDIFATGITTVSGNIKVGTGITLSPDGDGFYTGVVTATTFSGALAASSLTGALPAISAANLTNVPAANITGTLPAISGANLTILDASDLASGTVPTARLGSGTASSSTFLRGDSTFAAVTSTTINSNTNNYLITGTGTSDTLQGETDLQFDGAHLTQAIAADAEGFDQVASGNHYIDNIWNANRSSAGSAIGRLTGQWNGTEVASIKYIAGSDTTNKDDAHITFHTATSGSSNAERVRIDSEGRLVVGHTAAQLVNSSTHRLQLIGTNYATSGFSQQRYQNDSSGASLLLAHSRNGTIGSHTALQSGDELGKIRFMGSDGGSFDGFGAQIVVTADGNFSSNSLPSKFAFGTTPNGSASPTTRMTIDQNGYVKINSTDSGGYHTIRLDTTTNNAIKEVMQIVTTVDSATAADGFGNKLSFAGENLNGNSYTFGSIGGRLSTTGSGYGHLSFYTNNNGTIAEKMRITDASSGQIEIYGNSASIKTIESGGATAIMQSGGNQAYFGTPSGNSKAVTFTVAGSQIAHFTTSGDMMLDNQLQTTSGVQPIGMLTFASPTAAQANQVDMYRINFWENARSITATRTDNANASIRYNGSTDDGGDGSIRFANESGTRLLYMNRLGNGGTSGAWSVGSDQRKKENITTVSDALTKVSQLRGVDFNWRSKWGGHADSGVIAQEVESVLPNLVITQEGARDTDADGNSVVMKHVNYNGLWGAMIEAVKELKSKNEALEARIAALEG